MLWVRGAETGWALWCLTLKQPWRFGAGAPQRIASFDPSAEMAQAIWDRGSAADCVSREAEASQRVEPREAEASQLFRCFSQRAFVEMPMADAAVKAVGSIKRTLPNGSRQGGMARFAR